MIKNLLYSLFLHITLLLLIYLTFNIKKEPEVEKEITVSLAPFSEEKKPEIIEPPIEKLPEEKLPEEKLPEKILPIEKPPEEKPIAKKIPEEKKPKIIEKKEVAKKPEPPKEPIKPKEVAKPKEIVKKIEEPKPIVKKEIKEEVKPPVVPEVKPQEDKPKEDKSLDKLIYKLTEKSPEEKPQPTQNIEKNVTPPILNSLESLNLSPREKLNIQSQLKRCYQKTINENKSRIKITIVIKAKITKDGYINSNLEDLIDTSRYNNPQEIDYKIAIDNVNKAIALCSPLRNLPLDKYDIWKEVSLEFDGTGLH